MTTTPTAPTTDQPAPTGAAAPTGGQFPTTAPNPPYAGASAYPPPAYGPVPGYPAEDRTGFAPGSGPAGFVAEASAMVPPPVPARRRTAWLVAGCTLIAVALLQLTRLPEWIADDRHGLVGDLTGVVALIGIGIALILTGRERRR